MKKSLMVLMVLAVVMALAVAAFAVAPGKELVYENGAMGKVTFSGKTHADAGLKCMDCHPKVFEMKKGAAKITMAEHVPGKYCGVCHDGTKAFAQKGNCNKCHVK